MYQFNSSRRSSISSIVSSWSFQSDDDEVINNTSTNDEHAAAVPRGRQSSTYSERSCDGMTAGETRDLWKCMLELQERYGCYNSTRIDLAVGAGDEAVDLMRKSP